MSNSAWTLLHARIHRTLRSRQLLQPQQKILIAVSGGQDSLCLARLLLDLRQQWNWELAIGHCNHRWRVDSDANAEYVAQLAQSWQVPCICRVATASLKSEAAARQWRYQMLSDMALEKNFAAVVAGHTASDRAETLLYNLMRGSGADGLQALTWQRELVPGVALVRPLLETSRSETATFCQTAGLTIWEDSTNQDQRYARNRIRQALIPYLQAQFNPQVEQALAQTAELLRAEVEYLEQQAASYLQQAINPAHPTRLNRLVLKTAPLALQRRTVRQFLQQVLPQAPAYQDIEKLIALLAAPNRSQTDPFMGGTIARVSGDWIEMIHDFGSTR